jgi:hypothetical protein
LAKAPSQLRRDLRTCTVDGACYTLMLGLGQEYFAKLAVLLGLGDATVGLIESIPPAIATLAQQFSILLIIAAGSYRRVVWVSAAFQGITLFLLAALTAWASTRTNAPAAPPLTAVLFALVSLYYIGAFAGGPAWMALIGMAIPNRVMPRYLGRRTLILHAVLLTGLLGGGYALQHSARHGHTLATLAVMFTLAGLARLGSAVFLSRYREDPFTPPAVIPYPEVLRRVRSGPDGRALTFLVGMQAAMWVGFPFFRPYMLNRIGPAGTDDSIFYSSLLGAFYLGKMIAPEIAGRAVDRFGLRAVTWASTLCLIPVPLLWLASHDRFYLLSAQLISGAALASFELCAMLLQLEHVPIRERASVLSTFNLALFSAGLAGSLLGGALLGTHASPADYATVFALSTALRFAALSLLSRVGHAAPDSPRFGPAPPAPDPGGESLNRSVVKTH